MFLRQRTRGDDFRQFMELQILNAIFLGILCGIGMLYFRTNVWISALTTLYANTSRVGWIIAALLTELWLKSGATMRCSGWRWDVGIMR